MSASFFAVRFAPTPGYPIPISIQCEENLCLRRSRIERNDEAVKKKRFREGEIESSLAELLGLGIRFLVEAINGTALTL